MNRAAFMRQLESMLQGISPTEREEALQYYNDYFDDAGEENEKAVIEALGNPARVAENIKKDLLENGYGEGSVQGRAQASDRELIEYGREEKDKEKESTGEKNMEENLRNTLPPVEMYSGQPPYSEKAGKPEKAGIPGWAIALLVVLLIFGSPVVAGLFGILLGLLISWFALIFSFGMVAIALFIVLAVLVVVGIMCMLADPVSGLALVGGGLVCGSIGILFMMLTVAMAGIVTPAIFKGIFSLFSRKSKK